MLLLLCSYIPRLNLEDSQLHPLSSYIFHQLSQSWLRMKFVTGRCYCTHTSALECLGSSNTLIFRATTPVDSI